MAQGTRAGVGLHGSHQRCEGVALGKTRLVGAHHGALSSVRWRRALGWWHSTTAAAFGYGGGASMPGGEL
jgi:hypothetical protein